MFLRRTHIKLELEMSKIWRKMTVKTSLKKAAYLSVQPWV